MLPARLLASRLLCRFRRRIGAAYLTLFLGQAGVFALFLTYYFQDVLGYSPIKTGIAFLPMMGAIVVVATLTQSVLVQHLTLRVIITGGLLIGGSGAALLTQADAGSPYAAWVLPGLILARVGIGSAIVSAVAVGQMGVEPRDAGTAGAVNNVAQQLGPALGIAVISTFVATATSHYLTHHGSTAAVDATVHGFSVATPSIAEPHTAKAQALADQIGNGSSVGKFGAAPQGEIVIVAVLYQGALDVVANYGDAPAGKILIDITNPFNDDASALVTTSGNSMSQQIAPAAPAGTHVVKALNTIFGHVLAEDEPPDAFIAGDNAEAKARVTAFLTRLDIRPLDAGAVETAYALEWAGLLLVGLARNGAGFDLASAAEAR